MAGCICAAPKTQNADQCAEGPRPRLSQLGRHRSTPADQDPADHEEDLAPAVDVDVVVRVGLARVLHRVVAALAVAGCFGTEGVSAGAPAVAAVDVRGDIVVAPLSRRFLLSESAAAAAPAAAVASAGASVIAFADVTVLAAATAAAAFDAAAAFAALASAALAASAS